ncbi:unnamed protein product [Heterobilharzia americana]|nr:unnamed protein product [Heterobilharzia americana]
MVMKFCKYDQYQLAKHCKHKARATRATKSKMRKAKPDSGLTDDHVDTFTHRLTNSPPVHFTMKDLIRRLHISRPKYNVMCILGKTYPVDSTDFIRMGLEGDWDESRAGKRMRLPVPLTWETELSINGNNSESWTKLITSNKVPHMAMLRNLRNILKSGIQNNVHEIVLRELINPDIIVEGKQFPFRYFAAFDVVHELKNKCMLQKYIHAVQNARRRKLKIISDRLKKKHLWLNKYLQSTSFKRSLVCDIKLLDRYEKALSEALDLSVRYNLPPIRGSTLIICSNSKYVNVSKQLKSSRSKSYMSIMGFLLGTMCTSMCEASSNYIKVDDEYHVVPIEDIFGRNELNRNRNRYIINNILNKEETGTQKMKQNMNESNNSDMAFCKESSLCMKNVVISNLPQSNLFWRDFMLIVSSLTKLLSLGIVIDISYLGNLSGEDEWPTSCHKNTNNRVLSKRDYIKSHGIVVKCLFHLHFVICMGNVIYYAICLEQAAASDIFVLLLGDRYGWVPNDDQIQNLPKPLLTEVSKFYKRGPLRERRHGTISFQEAVRRRICVFIRDSKSVRGVPIELRSEFEEADIEKRDRLNSFKELIRNDGVIVFHDYPAQFNGLVTDQPVMGSLDEFGNKFLSVLKSLLLQLYEAPMTDSGSSLSTVVRKPSNTTEFLRVYVYSAACAIAPRHLLEVERAFDALTERGRQVHLVRRMALDSTKSNKQISSKQSMDSSSRSQLLGYDGSVLLITGSAGSGKTTYLSALAISLTEADWYPPSTSSKQSFNIYNPKEQLMSPGKPSGERRKFVSQRPKLAKHHILMHFSGGLAVSGLPPKRHLSVMLKKWTKLLISQLEDICSSDGAAMKLLNEIKLSLGMSTSQANTTTAFCDVELRSLIQCFTQIIKFIGYLTKLRFAFLIDDCHELQPTTLEWLPVVLPKNVRFVLTSVSGLTTNERCAAVRSLLGRYGKVLSESGFQNQLSILVRKRDADVPLYLRLACEELRLYGTYEQLDEKLKQLPDTISSFVEHAIRRVELDCGSDLTRVVLGFLICSRCPLSTDELHGLVDEWLCESAIKDEFEEGNCNADPWKELTITSDDISLCLDKMYLNESVIQKVITGQWSNDMHRSKSFRKQPHLPSLALHILLTGLHPLLSGFSDEGDFIEMNSDDDDEDLCEKSIETIKRQKLTIWNLGSKAISFRSCELRDLVNDICFNRLNYASTHQKFASYYNKPKRSNDEIHLKTVTLKTIHNILAKQGSNMKDVIYHLYHAERLDIVACLLSSPTFLIHQIQSGYGSTLLEDFRRCVTTDRNDQLLTRKEDHPSINDMNDKIIAMQTFIASNYELLTKHPSSFAELAINQDVSEWIQKVGLVYLFYSDPPDVDPSQRQMFFSIKRDRDIPFSLPKVVQPFLIHKPVTPLNGSRDVPISVAIDRMGTLLAYGTESGTVNVVQIQSMKVLCSFLGHNLPILSLCFIDGACIEYGIPSSQLWLVSTCEDGGIIVWDISNVNQEVTYKKVVGVSCQLFSLSGHHRRSVTNSAWHPERRLLATGSLDCLLCLWDLGDLGFGSISTSRALGFGQVKPSKRFEVNSPINALAFRFPRYKSNDENSIAEHLRDVIAIGCWDGFVHFYSLISMSKIKSIAVSCFSICSLAYSPNGGNTLAILDTGGQTYLLDADTFVYLGSLTEHTNFSPVWNSCSPEKKLHLLPNQRGSVCFSKPNGRYLIQTGSGSSGGRINVWNACPGARQLLGSI